MQLMHISTFSHFQGHKLREAVIYTYSHPEGLIKRVTVMVPVDMHKELKLHAVSNDTTLQDCILTAIKEHLQHECKTVNLAPKSAD